MNKIININLAGQAIAIDEKAYDSLSNYMRTLENHFKNTDSGSEILQDIEARMAEMFLGKIKAGHEFIDQDAVDEAIEVMGRPSDMGIEDETSSNSEQHHQETKKKLFRDSDDKVIGGVCSGLAAYFDLDVSLIRIAFVISVVFFGVGVLPYILLWIVLPEAITAQDKFRMRGETPDIDDIAKKIRNEAENVANNIKKNDSLNRTFSTAGDILTNLVRWFAKLFSGGVLIALIIIGVSVAATLVFTSSGGNIYVDNQAIAIPQIFESEILTNFFFITLASLILIPIAAVIYLLICFIFNIRMHRFNLKAIFAVWLICLAAFIGISIYGSGQLQVEELEEFQYELRECDTV